MDRKALEGKPYYESRILAKGRLAFCQEFLFPVADSVIQKLILRRERVKFSVLIFI